MLRSYRNLVKAINIVFIMIVSSTSAWAVNDSGDITISADIDPFIEVTTKDINLGNINPKTHANGQHTEAGAVNVQANTSYMLSVSTTSAAVGSKFPLKNAATGEDLLTELNIKDATGAFHRFDDGLNFKNGAGASDDLHELKLGGGSTAKLLGGTDYPVANLNNLINNGVDYDIRVDWFGADTVSVGTYQGTIKFTATATSI